MDLYHKAISLYKNCDFETALELFTTLENNPLKTNTNIYKIYLQRCEEYIKTPPKGLLEIPCQSDKIISRIEHGRTN